MTYTRRRSFCCAKYFALSSISSSVIALAILSMFWLGRYSSGPDGLARATAKIVQLLLEVRLGQSRQRGIFRPALAGGRVAVGAGHDVGLAALAPRRRASANDRRPPVGRIERIVDARQREFFLAVGNLEQLHVIELRRAWDSSPATSGRWGTATRATSMGLPGAIGGPRPEDIGRSGQWRLHEQRRAEEC